jgi:hypothetical protein
MRLDRSRARTKAAVALAAAGAMVAAVTLAPGSTAAEPGVDVAGLPDRGTVELRTSGSGASVRYLDAAGTLVGSVLPVTAGCPAAAVPLLRLGQSSGPACFGNRGYGVGAGAPVSYLNPAISGTEVFSIALGGLAAEYEIRTLDLDIEAIRDTNQSEDILLVSYDADGTVLERRRLNLTSFPRRVTFPRNFQVRVDLQLPASRVTLAALGDTAFQVEGDTQPTRLGLTDITDVLRCGERLVVDGAEVTLIGNDCPPEPVLVVFDPDTQILEIRKDEGFDGILDVRTTFTQEASTELDLVADYFDGAGERTIPYCEDDGAFDPDDLTTVLIPVDALPGPARDGACLLGRAEAYVGDGLATYDVRFVLGVDPRIRLRD